MSQNITLERQVVGSTGVITDGNWSFYYTVGEAVIQTFAPTAGPIDLTQGFQQPDENDAGVDIRVLTGFTPNGDGVNDKMYIENIEKYPENKVTVLNRWGTVITTIDNYQNYSDNAWDGMHHGKPVVGGTYFYIVDVTGAQTVKGWVEVTR